MQNTSQQSDLMFLFKKWEAQLYTYPLSNGSLTMMPAPPGEYLLPKFAKFMHGKNYDVVVSLLRPSETSGLRLEHEASSFAEVDIEFLNFPIKDHSVPNFILPFKSLVFKLSEDLESGKNVAIHCYAGIGRTGLLSASLLINNGHSVDSALIELSRVRGLKVPETLEQISWLHRYENFF